MERDSGWAVGQGEVIVLAREQIFSKGTDAFHLEMSTASHVIERESTGLSVERTGVRHRKGLQLRNHNERKYKLFLPPTDKQRAQLMERQGLAGVSPVGKRGWHWQADR